MKLSSYQNDDLTQVGVKIKTKKKYEINYYDWDLYIEPRGLLTINDDEFKVIGVDEL